MTTSTLKLFQPSTYPSSRPQHLDLVDRHLFALRNALALARALGRELVLPRMLCFCERAQQPWNVLPGCVKEGASTQLPFVCPVEQVTITGSTRTLTVAWS